MMHEVLERWGATALSIQTAQQRLVAAAGDMEQHTLDMHNLTLEICPPIEGAMNRFVALVHPGGEVASKKTNLAGLAASCKRFEAALEELKQRALAPLALPEVFARMHGQLQQQKDSINAWCYPLLKLKQEVDLSDASSVTTAPAVRRANKGEAKRDERTPEVPPTL